MEKLPPKYSVILRADLPPRERSLLEHFCSTITSDTGEALLHFWCTRIDTSHHFYIEMDTFKPPSTETHPLRVPHHFVFLISGDDKKGAAGFLAEIESKES